MPLITHSNDWNHGRPIRKCSLFTVSNFPNEKRVETILEPPTTPRPYAFLPIPSMRSGRILGAVHRLCHPGRLSVARDISRRLGYHCKRMVTVTCHREPVLRTTVYIGHRNPRIGDDLPNYARSCRQLTPGCRGHSKGNC